MTRVLLWCIRALAWALLAVLVVASAAWCVGALVIAVPGSQAVRHALAVAVVAVALAALVVMPRRRWRWRVLGAYLALFVLVLGWYLQLEPSNDRDWVTENARLPHATIDGNIVTVHNMRNFDLSQRNRLHAGLLRQELRLAPASKAWTWSASTGWGRRSRTSS